MLKMADLINSLLQSIVLSYIPYYCIKKDKLIDGKKRKLILSITIMYISILILTPIMATTSLGIIFMDICMAIILACIYFKDYKKIVIGYASTYFMIQVASIIFSNIQWSYIRNLFSVEYIELSTVIVMYLPSMILEVIMLLNADKIYKMYKFISNKKYGFDISIIVILSLDSILALSIIIHGNDIAFFKNVFIILLIVLLVILLLYFINMKNKIDEISKLNSALQDKNNELKKVKHDYGSQISYINGLYIMEQYERLGDVLKGVITGNESISDNLKLLSYSDSIISVVINSLDIKNTNIIVEEEYHISNLNISEYELQKIITNIISNAVTAMNDSGLIVIKTYKIFGNVYINIKNNGPKISDEIIDKIFKVGFTTKSSSENGFGLSIVKDLVEKNNGNISVISNNDFTEFKIIFKV